MESATIKIAGMTCMGCVRSVTNVLQELPGVSRAEVSLDRGEAQVEFDSARVFDDCAPGGGREGGVRGALTDALRSWLPQEAESNSCIACCRKFWMPTLSTRSICVSSQSICSSVSSRMSSKISRET